MDFFDRVKELCKENGLTVKSLVEELEINYEKYNGLKRHDNCPRADEALKIAERLGVTVEYLVTGKSEPYKEQYDKLLKTCIDIYPLVKNLDDLLSSSGLSLDLKE